MARRKKVKDDSIKIHQSYRSLLYGIITVAVLFVVLLLISRIFAPASKTGEITEEAANTSIPSEDIGKVSVWYTVKAGDSLWSISEEQYKSGFQWKEIARVNNIQNPGDLTSGTKLIIPKIPTSVSSALSPLPTQILSPTPMIGIEQAMPQRITGTTYIVKSGDNLWDIAIRAYGDGYKWVDLARVNNLVNPDVIHSGNMLKLPR